MSMPSTTQFMSQTPTISLREIADRLWAHGEHEAYRAVLAFIKEREAMLLHIKDLEKE